jgi:hypothetical protein
MKILAICPNSQDATAFYRVLMPLLNLQKTGHITFEITDNPSFAKLLEADIVFLQRPCTEAHLGIAERCKLYNKPLVVDYDDNLFVVPESNPAYSFYATESVRNSMAKCIQLADHVIVSTKPLQAYLTPLNASISVVPNSLDLSLMPERKVNWEHRKTDIMWRGTNTHTADVASVAPQIAELSKLYPNWRWLFMGVDYRMLEAFMAPGTYGYAGNFPEMSVYLRKLQQLSAPIHIVPLEDNEFNKAKSNLAWLEATWAGSAVIAPDMEEWNLDCTIPYETGKFGQVVSGVMHDPDMIKEFAEASWELIQSEYLIEHVNQKRLEIFRSLLA